jgi:hypothetical protein
MPVIPESTKTSLAQRLRAHAKVNWPQLAEIHVRFRGQFAYVAGELADGEQMPLMRLRYGGSAHRWGTAIYVASKDSYENQIWFSGSIEETFDLVCDLHVPNAVHWSPTAHEPSSREPPKDLRPGPLAGTRVHLHPCRLHPGGGEFAREPHAVEHLQAAGVHRDRPRLGGRRRQLVDDADGHTAAGELDGGDQADGPGPHDDDG